MTRAGVALARTVRYARVTVTSARCKQNHHSGLVVDSGELHGRTYTDPNTHVCHLHVTYQRSSSVCLPSRRTSPRTCCRHTSSWRPSCRTYTLNSCPGTLQNNTTSYNTNTNQNLLNCPRLLFLVHNFWNSPSTDISCLLLGSW